MIKKFYSSVFFIMIIIMMCFCLCGILYADIFKIGVAGAHSGDLASYGIPSVRAAELVVEAVNAKGRHSWQKS